MIVLIAKDTAPSKALGMVADELRSRNEPVTLYKDQEATPLPVGTTLVLSGMAHNAAGAEIELRALREAAGRQIPRGLYADTFDCAGRDWFTEARSRTNFLFVPTESEKTKAANLFPKAEITATGNPIWEASAFPDSTRAGALTDLKIFDGQTVIFCPMRKEAAINFEHLKLVGEALKSLEQEYVVIVGTHPGDQNLKTNPDFYKDYLPANSRLSSGIPTKNILPAADLVINAASGAGIDAIFQRVPVIDLLTSAVLDETERLHGRRVWQPVEDGASIGVSRADGLASAVENILSSVETRNVLARAQDKNYPKPGSPDQAVRTMADLILKYRK